MSISASIHSVKAVEASYYGDLSVVTIRDENFSEVKLFLKEGEHAGLAGAIVAAWKSHTAAAVLE